MAPRLKDIAEKANVDVGTVSHVLNNRPKAALLRPSTRERILAIAGELGYKRNELARAVRSGRSRVIAFASYSIGDFEYIAKILGGMLETMTAAGYSLKVFQLTSGRENEIADSVIGQRIEGVIFHAPHHSDFIHIQERLVERGIACATVNISNPLAGFGVTSDDAGGMNELVGYVLNKGYKRLVFCHPNRSNMEYIQRRQEGFMSAVGRLDGKIESFAATLNEIDLKAYSDRPTAILCSGDDTAMRLMMKRELDRALIPEKIGITGFGDLVCAMLAMTPLTTVAQPFAKMGALAAEKIIALLEDGKADGLENIMLKTKIIERASTALTGIH